MVLLLLDNKADVNKADKDGDTPLYAASETGHYDVANLLVEKGAAVDKANKDGITPLEIALKGLR